MKACYYEWNKRGGWALKYSSADEDEVLWKFVNFSWWDFFDTYIVPTILDDICLGCVVTKIDYSSNDNNNGIIKVTAADKATGKSQDIRIEASSGLTDEEIEKMKAEAEANAEADKAAKEEVEIEKADLAVGEDLPLVQEKRSADEGMAAAHELVIEEKPVVGGKLAAEVTLAAGEEQPRAESDV